MRKVVLYIIFLIVQLSFQAQSRTAEDFYISAFQEISNMLAGRDTVSIKRAVFLAEWAYYEGKLDYKTDFCDEIDRIKAFIRSVYTVNKLHTYKTGMQMAISSYMMSPHSEIIIHRIPMILKLSQLITSLGIDNLSPAH